MDKRTEEQVGATGVLEGRDQAGAARLAIDERADSRFPLLPFLENRRQVVPDAGYRPAALRIEQVHRCLAEHVRLQRAVALLKDVPVSLLRVALRQQDRSARPRPNWPRVPP